MPARLLFLGRLQDLAGNAEQPVETGPIEEILADLPTELVMALLDDRVRIALNGELIAERGGIVLGDGDELAFLPPVSGG